MNLKFFSAFRHHIGVILPPIEVFLVAAIVLFVAAAGYVIAEPAFLPPGASFLSFSSPRICVALVVGAAFLWISRKSVAFGILALFAWTMAAHAQDAGGATAIGSTGLAGQILSYLFDTGVTLLGLAGAWIIKQIVGILGITDTAQRQKVEDATRKLLHFTIENGLKYAFSKAGVPASLNPSADIIADAMFYVQNHSPEAVSALNVNEDALKRLILAKLQDVVPWVGISSSDTVASQVVAAPA